MEESKRKKIQKVFDFELIESPNNDVVPYDSYLGSALVGHLDKKFIMSTNDNLRQTIHKSISEENNYLTYLNCISQENLPEKISILRKNVPYSLNNESSLPQRSAFFAEIIASKILNYYGCKTPLNIPVKESKYSFYIYSIDFISENETFNSFDNLKAKFQPHFPNLENDIEQIDLAFKTRPVLKNYPKEEIDKVKKDFASAFLVRKFLLNDIDAHHTNCGLLLNEKENKLNFLSFDYESSFDPFNPILNESVRLNLEYCKNNFPDVYDNFIKKTKELHQGLTLMLEENTIDFASETHRECISLFYENLTDMYTRFKRLEEKELNK